MRPSQNDPEQKLIAQPRFKWQVFAETLKKIPHLKQTRKKHNEIFEHN